MSKLDPISHFISPVSCDSLVLQGLRCEWGAGVLNLVLSLSLSHTGHWKFNMAPHGKELKGKIKAKKKKKSCCFLHKYGVGQGCPIPLMAIDCPAKFISNSNQTYLKQLIKIFRIAWKLKAGVFDYSWRWTLQDSRSPGAGLGTPGVGYKEIAKTLKLSCSTVAKTMFINLN